MNRSVAEVQLAEVCSKIGVGLAMAVTPHMTATGVKLIRNQNIRPNRFDDSSVVFLDPTFAASQAAKTIQAGDVVIVRTGANIGHACVVPQSFDGCHSFTTLIARPNKQYLSPHYLAQYVNSSLGRAEVERLMAGGGKGNLNSGELERFRITLAPIGEQEKIATILTAWDVAVETSERLIAAQERHYTHELHRTMDRSEGRAATLGDFLTESRLPSPEADPRKRLTVRLHLRGVEPRDFRGTEDEDATVFFRRRAGQLIYGKQNIFRGALGTVPDALDGYCSSQDLPAFDIYDEVNAQWLLLWLSRKSFYRKLESLAAGSGSKRLHQGELLKLRLKVPARRTQSLVANYLNALREEVSTLHAYAEKLKLQKRGLMQKLLMGQWRVKVPRTKAA